MNGSGSAPHTEISVVSTNIELEFKASSTEVGSTTVGTKANGTFAAAKRVKWNRFSDSLLRKSTAVYAVVIAFIWLIHTVPIILFVSINAKFHPQGVAGLNDTRKAVTECSRDFFLDNSSGLCRPECGEWDQYSPATRRAVYGVNITFALLTIIVCVVAIVWSIFRHKIMCCYPNIILIYISLSHILLMVLHLVGYTDEKALYCPSRDRVTSFERGTAYCSIIGSATTFVPTFELTGLCFHLGTVLFTAYFPFQARKFEKKKGYKYLHLVALICGFGFSGLLVGFQFAVGGYRRNVVPIFCIAAPESAFFFGIIPVCIISAMFLTVVMVLLFKIIDIDNWKLKLSQKEEGNSGEQTSSPSSRYTSAQIRLVLIFCTHGLATLIIYSAYSVVLRHEHSYAEALEEYFECEASGNNTLQTCSREMFEELDPTSITFPLVIGSYVLLPLSTLVYVADIDKISNVMRKAKFKFLTKYLW